MAARSHEDRHPGYQRHHVLCQRGFTVWWQYIIIAAVILLGIYGFLVFTRFETRNLSRRTSRTAADMYPSHADSARRQRRHAREHGGEQARDDDGRSREPRPADGTDQ